MFFIEGMAIGGVYIDQKRIHFKSFERVKAILLCGAVVRLPIFLGGRGTVGLPTLSGDRGLMGVHLVIRSLPILPDVRRIMLGVNLLSSVV